MVRAIALLVCGLTPLFCQTSSVPYAPNNDAPRPTFTNETVTDSLLVGKYSSIQKVDFRNLKPLKNGRYRQHVDGVHYSEELDKVYYLDTPTSNEQAALVLYSWFSVGGSSSQGSVGEFSESLVALFDLPRKSAGTPNSRLGNGSSRSTESIASS